MAGNVLMNFLDPNSGYKHAKVNTPQAKSINSFLTELSPSNKEANALATLEDSKGTVLLRFLFNPETIEYSFTGNYGQPSVAGSKGNILQYFNRPSTVYKLPDLLLDTYQEGLSLENYLNKLKALTEIPQGSFEPVTVFFKWGSRKLPACKVTSVNVIEKSWLAGQFAVGRVSIELTETVVAETVASTVPQAGSIIQSAAGRPTSISDIINSKLTPRQIQQATSKVTNYLTQNSERIPIESATSLTRGISGNEPIQIANIVRQSLRDKSYKIDINSLSDIVLQLSSGDVTFMYNFLPILLNNGNNSNQLNKEFNINRLPANTKFKLKRKLESNK